eukprot:CAMPEP_0175949434 /NCGR_PEP_ID=MMETSP0108-20121206/29030_1 /TAXON_ID=195067 ORGANISM="Goniomonas pacifica, Strain CCMP1869" /NCGR_SAMPLE_ID=MMETSP0108 /ASSEMBLY_ACC=CAM_ASM_000204 /LENGTH=85 /DNA_ID=CAMNT_0017275357 /DNA_START=131 /DNA_END=388 /DNA_ORIENTATION=-
MYATASSTIFLSFFTPNTASLSVTCDDSDPDPGGLVRPNRTGTGFTPGDTARGGTAADLAETGRIKRPGDNVRNGEELERTAEPL